MARCPHCHKILPDAWVKTEGARLMGRSKGEAKARSPEQARASSRARWDRVENAKREQKFTELRTLAGVRQPKQKPK